MPRLRGEKCFDVGGWREWSTLVWEPLEERKNEEKGVLAEFSEFFTRGWRDRMSRLVERRELLLTIG